ncbi:MAG: hypothetical protein HY508_12815 [Acidobacteria bacterium]|nr:hypothetical protein [Acidobacteriota bacterium]
MAPKTDFAIVVYDPMSEASPVNLVLQGDQMETWGAETCEDRARLLDHAKPKVVLREARLAAGLSIDALSLSEPSPPCVVVIGALTDQSLFAAGTEGGTFDRTIPPFEVEALVQILKGSVNNAGNTNGAQQVRAVA